MVKIFHLQFNSLNNDVKNMFFDISVNACMDTVKQVLLNELNGIKYVPVAEVDTDSLDQAFYLTNSIDDYWGNNPESNELTPNNRSTSVGDLILKDNKLFLVGMIGFEEVPECPI